MRKWMSGLAFVLLLATGCQKINYEKSFEVAMGLQHPAIEFSAPAYSQKVTATITPEKCAVSAYLIKASDEAALEDALNKKREPAASLLLAGKTFSRNDPKQEIVLQATIPAKTAYKLIIKGGNKTTEVKVKVVGK